MRRLLATARYDVLLQARQGFYAATAFLVVVVAGLLLTLPADVRADHAFWVPALFAVNLPITTLFFIAGLMLLERDEGTLAALGVTPVTANQYLGLRMITLVTLAILETLAVVMLAFGSGNALMLLGAVALGVFYTGCGAGLTVRYESINELLLPGSVFVTFLLLPVLPQLGLAPREPFLAHPVEPALTLIRGSYRGLSTVDAAYAVVGSIVWGVLAWRWGTSGIARLMRMTAASGGR